LSRGDAPTEDASTIARSAVRGSLWLTGANYAGFVINILTNLCVMRLLDRPEVGAYVLAFAVSEFVALVGAFSLELALIHYKDEGAASLLDTAYILSIFLGAIGAAISVALFFALAPFPSFTLEVRVFIVIMGLLKPLLFLAGIYSSTLEREFRYRDLSLWMFGATTLPGILALGFALAGAGALSLVSREIFLALFSYLAFGLAARWRCGWKWSSQAARLLFRYSTPMFFIRVLEVALQRFDRLTIGSAIGKDQLASYHNGRYLSEMGYTFAQPLSRLSFNVYSRVKDDLPRLNQAYRIVNYFIVRGAMLLALLLFMLPRDIVIATFGPKWLTSVPTARLLAPYAAALPVFSNMVQLLYGRGMLRQALIVRTVQVAVFVPGVFLATRTAGTVASAISLLAAMGVGIGLVVWFQRSFVKLAGREIFLPPVLACGLSALATLLLTRAIPGSGMLSALARLSTAGTFYLGALAMIENTAIREHYRYLRSLLS
jgi:O-antigen/teichoic acid export membrane protein